MPEVDITLGESFPPAFDETLISIGMESINKYRLPVGVHRGSGLIHKLFGGKPVTIGLIHGISEGDKWVAKYTKQNVNKYTKDLDLLVMCNLGKHRLSSLKYLFRKPLYYISGTPTVPSATFDGIVNVGLPAGAQLVKTFSILPTLKGIGLPLIGALAGYGTAKLVGFTINKAIQVTNKVNEVAEHVRSLEFGGTLGPGYRTGAAATERQRLVQELQNSSSSNRRFKGQEASLYSGII